MITKTRLLSFFALVLYTFGGVVLASGGFSAPKLWVHVPAPTTSFVANVKDPLYGAKGDGTTDDTVAIQRAIDAVHAQGGGVVEIPSGTYMIDATAQRGAHSLVKIDPSGLLMKSNVIIKFANDATLKAFPNASKGYNIITLYNVNNAHIIGGNFVGDRHTHQILEGQSGHGIRILSAQNIVIENTTARDFWWDGIYIGINSGVEPQSADIILYNVTMDNNRRQGLSITDGKRMKILNSTFKNTNGHMPQAGIDIEPNPSRTITDIEIRNNTFENNASFGVVVSGGQFNRDTEEGRKYADTITRNILVLDNTFTNNTEWIWFSGVEWGRIAGNTIRYANVVSAPTGGIRKLRLDELTRDVIIENNTIYGGGYPRGFIIEGQVKEWGGIEDLGQNNTIRNNSYRSDVYIRGNLQVGQTVTAHVLDGDIVPAEVQYQWKADGNPISSATQKMYRLQQNDYGKRISVTVNFTDLANNAESATSTVTNPIGSAQPNHTPRWLFVRNGTLLANKTGASVGEIVVQDPDPQDTHSYRVSDARFEVRENILKLKDDQRVDYTREQKIILSIEVTDSAGASFIRDDITLTVQENTQSPLGQKLGVHVPAPMTSFVANVKDPVYGAKGDGVTDDTVAIQKAIDAVHAQGGGIVEVPAGTYMIDAVTSLKMKSNVILRLNDATILKVIPNEQQRYALLSFHNVDNAHLLGGSLQGDRANHRGTAGERGMGVDIRSATNIVIENTIARDFWWDGIYLGKATTTAQQNDNIILYQVVADNNRRQGISITDGQNIKILNSELKNTNWTPPQAGIDIEPNINNHVRNVEIRNSKFINNTGQGIVLLVNKEADGTATISNVVIDNNEVRGNYAGIIAVNTSNHTITNNTISQSRMKIYSLSLGRTSNITVANNTILDGGIRNMDKNNTILFNNVFPATVYVYGVGQVGEHLRAEVVNDDSLPTNISYQWYADRVAIPNANSANYLITANEVNKTLTVGVRFTNGAGAEETATSLPTRRIRPWTSDPSNGDNQPPSAGKLWVHVPAPTTSFVANVKDPVYGAKGDGVADDTAAIQKAIDAVHAQGGGVVDIPAGTYMINATTYQGEHGLLMKNNVILRMTETTTLKALPNASQRYSIVSFIDVENAHIRGGTIEGERDQHLDTKGQWWHGINLLSASNIVLEGVTSKNNWWDGFYIGKATNKKSSDIILYSVTADNNRRQGLSITDGKKIKILNSTLKNTHGQMPKSGINIEPNPNQSVEDVDISNNNILNNHGFGIVVAGDHFTTTAVRNIRIYDNLILDNSDGIWVGGLEWGLIRNNTIRYSAVSHNMTGPYRYLLLDKKTQNVEVSGNTIFGGGFETRPWAIVNSGSNNTISNNTYKSAVFIRGNPLLGSKLTAKILDADLPPAEDQISYQWYRDEVAISDARAKTYQTVPKDIQKNLTVKVDFTDQEGNLESAISTAVQILDAPQNRTPYDILLSATTLSANQLGAKIGQITVKDHDQWDTHTLTVNDPRFEITNTTLQLKSGQKIEYTSHKTLTLQITARDQSGASFRKNFQITILNTSSNTGWSGGGAWAGSNSGGSGSSWGWSSSGSSRGTSSGGGAVIRDYCPNGDHSPSYYDQSCGNQPTSTEQNTQFSWSKTEAPALPIQKHQKTDSVPVKTSSSQALSFTDKELFNPWIKDSYCYQRKTGVYILDNANQTSSEELKQALTFLKSYELTIHDTIKGFAPDRLLTRQEAAKFFAQFAVNVLCRQADIDLKVQYSDIDHIPADLKQYVILATQLGLMKGNSQDNTFRPGDWISKAEVNAVIVRMLLKAHLSEPADQRYTHYNQAGAELGIIRQGAELEPIPRAYVALMLWRAYKPQAFVLEHQLTQDENLNKQNPIPKASYRLQNRSIFLKSKSS